MPPRYLFVCLPVADVIAPDNPAQYEIENTEIKTAPGVTLSDSQKLLTGSILDVSFQFHMKAYKELT
jgi:hypothetical protein